MVSNYFSLPVILQLQELVDLLLQRMLFLLLEHKKLFLLLVMAWQDKAIIAYPWRVHVFALFTNFLPVQLTMQLLCMEVLFLEDSMLSL